MGLLNKKIEIIDDSLNKLELISSEIKSLKEFKQSWKHKDIVERNLHKIIEALIDTVKIIISLKKLREPSTNREVFEILSESGLFPARYLKLTNKMVGLRNIIVHSYDKVDDAVIYGILKKNLKDVVEIKNYLLDLIRKL